jgi:sterol desaturase/sphingolipid hydroxylase (fatty acid hydroxylase superfamily)
MALPPLMLPEPAWAGSALPGGLALWLVAALTRVLGAALLEGLVLSALGRPYDWRASGVSLVDLLIRRGVDGLGLSLAAPVLLWAHDHRLATLSLDAPWQFALLFLGQELCYYGYHRAAHRVHWFWATHRVHHSPRQLHLAAALRLGWTGKLSGTALFFAPLVGLGFAPQAVLATLALNLLYQFWLHAPWIPRLGPLEWVLNTPAHHRLHHACNPAYLDGNYGGVLIVFDRLFGSFKAEQPGDPPRYGLVHGDDSHNPLRVGLAGWWQLGQRCLQARGWRARWLALFGPP